MRLSFIFLILLALSSCGFAPLYSDNNKLKTQNIISQIKLINNIAKKDFPLNIKIIYQAFKEELNRSVISNSSDIKYILQINSISESEYPLDLDMDGNISEYSYNIVINMVLQDVENNKIIFNKNYNSRINLSVKDLYYSSLISKRKYQEILPVR